MNTAEDGRGAGKIRVAVAISLPIDGPSPRLRADGVRGLSRDQYFRPRIQRQSVAIVLEQDQGLADGFARQRCMRSAAEAREIAGIAALFRRGTAEQSGDGLDAQDAPYRIVDASLRNLPGARLREGVLVQLAPAVRRHQHVDAGEYRRRAFVLGAARNLFVRVPVADHEALEAELSLQNVGQQIMIGVHFHAIPAVV